MRSVISIVVVAFALICCGPRWEDTIQHPNGVYENTKTGECWVERGINYIPVECPKTEK